MLDQSRSIPYQFLAAVLQQPADTVPGCTGTNGKEEEEEGGINMGDVSY